MCTSMVASCGGSVAVAVVGSVGVGGGDSVVGVGVFGLAVSGGVVLVAVVLLSVLVVVWVARW